MPVHGQHIGGLGAEPVEDFHLPAARLVQHGDFHSVAEPAGTVRQDDVHVLDIAVVADIVIGDVVRDVLYQGIVPHRDIMQGGVSDAGVLLEPARKGKIRLETAKAHPSGETDVSDILYGRGIRSFYEAPVVGFASPLLQALYLTGG